MYSVSLSGMLNRFRYVVLCLLKYQERFSLDYKKIRIPMLCSIRTPIRLSIKNVRTLNVRSAICTRSRARTGTPYQYWCLRPTRLPIPPSGLVCECKGRAFFLISKILSWFFVYFLQFYPQNTLLLPLLGMESVRRGWFVLMNDKKIEHPHNHYGGTQKNI